jgi:hypothetical protein
MEKTVSSPVVDRRLRDVKNFCRLGDIVACKVQYVSDVIAFEILERRQLDAIVGIAAEDEIEIKILRHKLTHPSFPYSYGFLQI